MCIRKALKNLNPPFWYSGRILDPRRMHDQFAPGEEKSGLNLVQVSPQNIQCVTITYVKQL